MIIMKKVTAFILALAVAASILAGCGSSQGGSTQTTAA